LMEVSISMSSTFLAPFYIVSDNLVKDRIKVRLRVRVKV
jgi:hypothetical protein